MRILCTGGAGFVGSHTAELIQKRGHSVTVVDNFSTGRSENLKDFKGRIQIVDITELRGLEAVFYEFQPEAVLHLAAQSAITTSMNDPQKDLTVNGIGTVNLLTLSKKYGVKRFVFSSTAAVYDESVKGRLSETTRCFPQSPYGISKLAAEHYVRTMFPNHLILRYGNVYGPRQWPIGENQVIARAFRHVLFGDEFKIFGDGNQKRDFVYVEDIAYCNFLALLSEVRGTFNTCTGKSSSVNYVTELIGIICGVPVVWHHTKEPDLRGDVKMSPKSIQNEMGWQASVPLSEGLIRTGHWWEEQK